ncbi:MAG: phosphoglycerate mutase family protein [Actinomycetota bacterium]
MNEERVYLVRHAKAGSRSKWEQDDRLRPLSKRGARQARKIAKALADAPVTEIVSSPYVRCVDTVLPLAAARGLPVVPDEALAEGVDVEACMALMKRSLDGAVLCSHGDVIPAAIEALAADGLRIEGPAGWRKGSTWVLEREDGRFIRARYVPPPDEV